MLVYLKAFYIFFGVLTLVGGLMGYLKAKSVMSLVAGALLGGLLLLAAALLGPEENKPLFIGLVASLAIAGKFIPDLITKRTLFPAGIMAVLSAISIALTILVWYPD